MARFLALCLIFCFAVSSAAGSRDDNKDKPNGSADPDAPAPYWATGWRDTFYDAATDAASAIGEKVQGAGSKLGEKLEELQATESYGSIAAAVEGAQASLAANLANLQDKAGTMTPAMQQKAQDAYQYSLGVLGSLRKSTQSKIAALREAAADAAPQAKAELQAAIDELEKKVEQLKASEGYVKAANRIGEVHADLQESIEDLQEKLKPGASAAQEKVHDALGELKKNFQTIQNTPSYQQGAQQVAAANARIAELQTQIVDMTPELEERAALALQRLKSRFEVLLASEMVLATYSSVYGRPDAGEDFVCCDKGCCDDALKTPVKDYEGKCAAKTFEQGRTCKDMDSGMGCDACGACNC